MPETHISPPPAHAPRAPDRGILLIAVWPRDDTQAAVARAHFAAHGYAPVPPDAAAVLWFRMEAEARALPTTDVCLVWSRPMTDDQGAPAAPDDTPAGLRDVLQALRKAVGRVDSLSVTVPESDSLWLLETEADGYARVCLLADAAPRDAALQRTCVDTALRLGHVEEAARRAAVLRVTHPDAPDALAASAAVALEQGRFAEAVPLLDRVLSAHPLDHMARARLLAAHQALGDDAAAAAVRDGLRAHGYMVNTAWGDRGRAP